MVERVQSVVIGAGVVGLAVARDLALTGREVVVIEAAGLIGSGTSSRNSEVIHAGIYYAKDSLKARLCVEGRHALYHYCAERGIPHRRVGKMIVAADDSEIEGLRALQRKGMANGVDDLRWLEGAEARALEPALACVAAVLSPSTGIIDSHALMLSLQGEAEAHRATVAFHSRALGGGVAAGGTRLRVDGRDGAVELQCSEVVNAAGLDAQTLAKSIAGMPRDLIPVRHLSKGTYFTASGASPFQRLIYPLPGTAGLGVHLTLDLAGAMRFGPDQAWVDKLDYDVDPSRAQDFYAAVRRYYPALADRALQPGYVGIRPKVQAPGEPAADFIIQGPTTHGVAGLVNLFGIESPGLTAALAIAREVRDRLDA